MPDVGELDRVRAERDRLRELLDTPLYEDFSEAVKREAAHQANRWGTKHDARKEPADWFWLIGYLAGKCLAACIAGNTDKALHHTISTAAVLCNWHKHILEGGEFTPGSPDATRERGDG